MNNTIFSVLGLLLLTGCAMTAKSQMPQGADPYEDFNRHMYAFNTGIDKVIVRPIAVIYQTLIPSAARTGVTSVFNNIDMVPTIFNDALQGQGKYMARDSGRFLVNTTLGAAGLFDVASNMNLPLHREDFGLTLAKWGYRDSSFLFLPIFGPSSVRDALGMPVNYAASIYPYIDDSTAYILTGTNLINTRSNNLNYDSFVYEAFDPYIAVKNAYLQKRQSDVDKNKN